MKPETQLILGLSLGSVLVWSQAIAERLSGRPLLPRHPRDRAAWSPIALAVTLLWLGWGIAAELWFGTGKPPEPSLQSVQNTVAANGMVLAVLLMILIQTDRLSAFGLRGDGWPRQLLDGALGFLASWLPVCLLLVLTDWLQWRDEQTQHSFLRLLKADPTPQTILWLLAAVAVFAPLMEELVFRVILQGALRVWIGPRAALAVAAVVFCAVHGWPDMLPLLPLALTLGYVYEQRHSYLAVVVTHALFNLIMLGAQLLSQKNPEAAAALWPF